jgi:NRPS condensation-like uncharacterized protein
MQHVFGRPGEYLIHQVLEFDGSLDEGILRRAAELLVRAVPVLGCRFVPLERGSCWELSPERELSPLAFARTADPERDLARFVNFPLVPHCPSRFRLGLFRPPDGRDRLVFKVDHICCDGRGLHLTVLLFASICRGLRRDPAYLPEREDPESRCILRILRALPEGRLLKALSVGPTFPVASPWGFPFRKLPPEGADFVLHRFEREDFRLLRAYARRWRVTFTDLLLTAYYRALFDVLRPEAGVPMPLSVTVDLRRWYLTNPPREGVTGNMTGVETLMVAREELEPFEATLERVAGGMREIKAKGPGLSTALFFEVLPRLGLSSGRAWLEEWAGSGADRLMPPLLSNLGDIGAEGGRISFGDLEATRGYLTGPALSPPSFLLCASTYDEELCLSAAFQRPCCSAEAIRPFLALIEEELRAARILPPRR